MNQALSSLLQISLLTFGYLYATSNIALAQQRDRSWRGDLAVTLAQVTSDDTVNTQVTQNGSIAEITGGETRGSNLFHSFQDFSVQTGNEAFFNNADSISNILSRVTGGNISNIDGLIRANGSASLFLINPAGIIFGENARLDIGGSFYSSTASSILFEDGEFSAVDNLQQPLLTINAPIGLSFRDNPGEIVNRANFGLVEETFEQEINFGAETVNVDRVTNIQGLEVEPGNDIALLGGNIFLERGGINVPGGNITLGGLSQAGQIDINADNSFSFPDDAIKADLSLSDSSLVSIFGEGGGSINVNVNNLSVIEQSRILSGIDEGMGNPNAVAGDIIVNADESITLSGSGEFEEPELDLDTAIRNVVGRPPAQLDNPDEDVSSAVGSSGSVFVNTNLLNITERSAIGVRVYGTGNARDVTVNANTIFVNQGAITSQVRPEGRGTSGDVNINANDFNATNFSFIITDNMGRGEGDAGDINLVATNSVVLEDDMDGRLSAFISEIGTDAVGNSGDINITANSLLMDGRMELLALTRGVGNAGNINLEITDSVVIKDDAAILAQILPEAEGNAGNITINTRSFESLEESRILASTRSLGNSGNIIINAQEIASFVGSTTSTGISETAQGRSGVITITSPQVLLQDRAIISSSTEGIGESSDININSDLISIDNFSLITASSISDIGQDSGSVNLSSDRITLSNGGIINSATSSNFDGGEINIDANVLELFSGGVIQTATEANGNAGNINLNISDRIILNGNNAPNRPVDFDFDESILDNLEEKTGIFANTSNNTFSNGGNINIDSNFIIAFPGGNNDILANSQQGQGGNININAEALFNIRERSINDSTNDINASSEFSLDGSVTINTPDINPVQGATELPTNVVEPGQTTEQACQANREALAEGGLNILGKGGIVPEPGLPLDSHNIFVSGQANPQSTIPAPIETALGKIQPARGVIVTESGEIILTAYRTNNAGDRIPEKRNCS